MFLARLSRTAVCACLFAVVSTLLTGCSPAPTASPTAAIAVTGNWQLSSSAAVASRLPALSGELTGTSASMTGVFHSDSTSACVSPAAPIEISGSADASMLITLTGANLAGGTLTISGTLAADGKSIESAVYMVTGGSCAFAAPAQATAQSYASITGNYSGTFSDQTGPVITIAASLTQTPASDTDGNFQLNGTANFGSNPCFSSPVSVSDTQVTGGSFSLTYADPVTTNSVVASGTFSTDGTTLTVTNWTLAGPCGPDQGTATLTKQ